MLAAVDDDALRLSRTQTLLGLTRLSICFNQLTDTGGLAHTPGQGVVRSGLPPPRRLCCLQLFGTKRDSLWETPLAWLG